VNDDEPTGKRSREEAIDEVAKDWLSLNHRMGNTDCTFEDARERVAGAVRRGDLQRSNNNR